MKKNNKGFTLIELLAVIVVLAIIMVIATTQINSTIKKSRADSFYDSVLIVEKNAKTACIQNGELTTEGVTGLTEYSTDDMVINVPEDSNNVEVKLVDGGKFDGADLSKLKPKTGITVSGNTITITDPCDLNTTSSN